MKKLSWKIGRILWPFKNWKKNKPTNQWVQNDKDDEFFTKENINAINEVLDAYIDNLVKLGANSSEEEIIKTVKEVVIRINDLNDKYNYFIETMEREDLYVFIDTAAKDSWVEIWGRHHRRVERMVK